MVQTTVEAGACHNKVLAPHLEQIALESTAVELMEIHMPWAYEPRVFVEVESASLQIEAVPNSWPDDKTLPWFIAP